MQGRWMNVAEFAELTRFKPESVRNMARQGRIPGARMVLGQWRIPRATAEALLGEDVAS